MIVTCFSLTDFRNYETFTLEPHPALTVLVGPNAIGKTNVIEALQLVTSGASFRRPAWSEIVRWGAEEARVCMRAQDGTRSLDVAAVVAADGTRTFAVDGRTQRRAADVVGLLPSVTFTPEDLGLMKGPAERRRAAADDLGEQLSATYGSLRRDYGRVVRQRNTLLREGAPTAELGVWDEQLASLGARLVTHRLRLLARVMDHASKLYSAMAGGETLSWSYEDRCGLEWAGSPGIDVEETKDRIAAEIVRRSDEERRRAVSLVGPHRDDVVFTIGERPARAFASQGQQRTAALAWKLAEVSVIEELMHRRPVLLLDDVMSELDGARRTALSEAVADRTQTFVTTTNLGYFDEQTLAGASVVQLGSADGPTSGRARR